MKTSSLHAEQDAETPYTTSQKALGHRDPATYHKGWLNSVSTNQLMKERMAKRARNLQPKGRRVKRTGANHLTEDICGLKPSTTLISEHYACHWPIGTLSPPRTAL